MTGAMLTQKPSPECWAERRAAMIARQLKARGIANEALLAAMSAVPREAFVPEAKRAAAYDDSALPIAAGQTISQPFIVARMLELAEPGKGERALEVGAGSGYAAAVLGRLCARVFAIERHKALAEEAAAVLARFGAGNVEIIHGDGAEGLARAAPFDVIIVSAGGAEIPPALRAQLSIGGRLVMPVGRAPGGVQTLIRLIRTGPETFETAYFDPVVFVPLIGGKAD